MDAFRALLEEKKKAVAADFGGRRYVKQSEVEGVRLKRLRDEEQSELEHKDAAKRARLDAERRALERHDSGKDREEALSREEVIRRLRLLGQPITLFGEDDAARAGRLRRVQDNYQAQDEHAGGQQGNSMLALQRGELGRKKAGSAGTGAAAAKERERREQERGGDADADAEAHPGLAEQLTPPGPPILANAAADDEPEDEVTAAFRRAAEAVKEKREEEAMSVEERIYKYLKRWFAEWGRDLDTRPDDAKASQSGTQMTLVYAQTEQYLKPLWKDLKRREVIPELVAGLYMIVQAVQQRNYLQAYDIYVRLAIGNSPWPIGVTSVGIHERSAREKISHVMNGAAHVMNNEATRKYLQGLKRLLTFMQRAHPTDPSRSVEFDGYKDAGRGIIGGGSDKQALLEAERRGETTETLRLEPAPHFHEVDGSVAVPRKWENILSKSEVFTKPRQPDSAGRTPPRTPP